jgi:hypothetical protein
MDGQVELFEASPERDPTRLAIAFAQQVTA